MRNAILGVLLVSTSMVAVASDDGSQNRWVSGIGYANLSDEVDEFDISVSAIVGSLGYKIKSGPNFYLMPEVRFGVGVADDTVSMFGVDVDIELDRFLALSVRGQFDLDSGIYLFAAPTYANAKFTASASQYGQSASITEDSWEFGLGLGAGYNFNSTTSLEISYEQFDGTDVLSLGLKTSF